MANVQTKIDLEDFARLAIENTPAFVKMQKEDIPPPFRKIEQHTEDLNIAISSFIEANYNSLPTETEEKAHFIYDTFRQAFLSQFTKEQNYQRSLRHISEDLRVRMLVDPNELEPILEKLILERVSLGHALPFTSAVEIQLRMKRYSYYPHLTPERFQRRNVDLTPFVKLFE